MQRIKRKTDRKEISEKLNEMPLEEAKHYLKEMRDFYTAGWMKIMGQ